MEKIYIVTEGCYSDYHIEAVFENREKAEAYCNCHEDCEIEEHDLDDNKIYTVFDSVCVNGFIGGEPCNTRFLHRCYEDDIRYSKNFKEVDIYGTGKISLSINRIIPNSMSTLRAEKLAKKIWCDYAAIIAYETSDLPKDYYLDFETRWAIGKDLNELLNQSHVSSEDNL